MRISVIIVNYNVKYFLRQCLASVFNSDRRTAEGKELDIEVWVVDNASVDGSCEMVRTDFPWVHLIENTDNVGFARANNQALRQAAAVGENEETDSSHCFLLLNPDTIVERDTLVKCAEFIHEYPDCGGLCVKMVDGEGRFLKESKRGFPTPEASFYKICGLTHLFPKSRRLAAYYMGHLNENETNEVEILPGAFLMFRHEVYEKTGGLDESYFMYGEDIDFSWRIRLAGFKNYYFPQTHIIHYKGESTRKSSMNYVYTFYNAMSIFVGKYYSGRNARLFNAMLQCAIWIRASLAWISRLARRLAVPVLDFAAAYGGFIFLKQLWATYWGNDAGYYPPQYTLVVIPIYILILMLCSWLSGGYDRPVRLGRIVRGMGIGLLMLLAFYSLLDEGQRYSRMLLLTGSLWTLASTLLIRAVLSAARVKGYALRTRERGRTLVIGSENEAARVQQLYHTMGIPAENIIHDNILQTQRLQDIIRIERVEEVVFCGADVDLRAIIGLMASLQTTGVEYRIAPSKSDYIIGSGGILSRDDLYLDELDTVSTDTSRRRKRMFDVGTATALLIATPLLIWFQKSKRNYLSHCILVLCGKLTWVGHTGRKGLFSPADLAPDAQPDTHDRLMLRYMRHYKTSTDAAILLRNWNRL